MTKKTHYAMIPRIASIQLTPYELALYTAYVQSCGVFNDPCNKSNATLASETKMSLSQVKRCKKTLEKMGYIIVKSGGDRKPSIVTYDPKIWDRNESECGAKHSSDRTMSEDNIVLTEPNTVLTEPKHSPDRTQTWFSQSHKEEVKKEEIIDTSVDVQSVSKNKYTPELKNLIAKVIFSWHDPSKVTPRNWKRVMKVLEQIFAVHDCYGTICTTQHINRFMRWYKTNKPGWGLPQNEGMETAYQEYYESNRHREASSATLEHILKVNLISEPPVMPEPTQFGVKSNG